MKKFLLFFPLLVVFISCNFNEFELDNIKPPLLGGTYAIPLGYAHYTMRELIGEVDKKLNLDGDSNTLIRLIYQDSMEFNSGHEIIDIGDIRNTGTINLQYFMNNTPNDITIRVDSTFTFNYPAKKNEEVDSVFYQAGELVLDITKSFPADLIYQITIENTRNEFTNDPVSLHGIQTQSRNISSQDLADYKTLFSFQNNQNTFQFSVVFDVVLDPGESISAGDIIQFDLIYSNQTFDLIFGNFGQDTIHLGNRIVELGVFEELGKSGLRFASPILTFDFENSFGVPMGILFQGMYGIKGDPPNSDTIYLRGAVTNAPQIIAPAAFVGEAATSRIEVNKGNSTIQELLSVSPGRIGFDLSAISNSGDMLAKNFLLDSSKVLTFITLDMPLEISLTNLTEEVTFNLGEGLKFDKADSVVIRVVSENGLPFSALLEFEIINDSNKTYYHVPNTLILGIPIIDGNGAVLHPSKSIADIPVGKEGITALNNGGRLLLRFTLNTSANTSRDTFVKVYTEYSIDLQVSLAGKLNYQL